MMAREDPAAPSMLTNPLGKQVIVALAVAQALLLLLFHEGVLAGWSLFSGITFRTVYLTLAVAVPTALYLLLNDPRRRFPWYCALGIAVVVLPLAMYAGSQCAPEMGVDILPVLVPFGLSLFGSWFVALAFMQAARTGRSLQYEALYDAAWHHALSLMLAGLFVGGFWLLLWLWGALFDVIGISFFEDLFTDRRFAYAATGLVGGVGLVLVRGFGDATTAVRGVLLALVKALLPLGAVIVLAFLAALPLTGLQPLWDTGRAAALMMTLATLMIVFLNGVFQTGLEMSPYPVLARRIVEAAFVTLPAYTVLSGYALALRVGQYGWTIARFWAAIVIIVLSAYALTYALAVFRGGRGWLHLLRPANRVLALAVAGLLLLANTPLLDPLRIAVNDQVGRLTSASVTTGEKENALRYLRFETGKRGYRALWQLQAERALAGEPRLSARLDTVLAHDRPQSFRAEQPSPNRLRHTLALMPDSAATPPPALYSALSKSPLARQCRNQAKCVLLTADLQRGTPSEYVLFSDHDQFVRSYVFAATTDSTWKQAGQMEPLQGARADSVMQALRSGRTETAPSRWRDLVVGGIRLERR